MRSGGPSTADHNRVMAAGKACVLLYAWFLKG